MVATLLSNGINVALDPLLIFGLGPIPAFGVSGAAAATVIAYAVGALFMAWFAFGDLRRVSPLPKRSLIAAIWKVGAPIGLSGVLDVSAFVIFAMVLARSGNAHLAAHVVVLRIVSVSFLPGHAIGDAAGVFVGQALGATRPTAARQAIRSAMILALVVMSACGVVFVAIPSQLLSIFSIEPDVEQIALTLMFIAAAFQFFDAIAMVAHGSLSGAGDTRFVMVLSVTMSWGVKLPLGIALALPLGMGAPGAWLGLTLEIILFAGIALWRLRSGKWIIAMDSVSGKPVAAK